MKFPQPAQHVSAFILSLATLGTIALALRTTAFADDGQLVPGLTAGKLTVNPGAVNFGDVTVGTSTTRQVTLTTTGGHVTVSSASSSSSSFEVRGISFPLTIAEGKSVSFNVEFAPKTKGADSGKLTFVSNALDSRVQDSIAGTGTAPEQKVILSWDASTSHVAGYNIYRRTGSNGSYSKLNSAVEPATTYTDRTVSAGKTYYYAAKSVGSDGKESGYSKPVEVAIP